ncbi:hypothetical protein [Cellulomonas sp. A375-1]|uniref:hypothetical protein n=1 Tax=Cellulomonas sp. A375-1 TaxID=1672219 RepID=UPI0012E11FC2|nr:hypothetical protein [Cellulomonas sp. A375-1]
MFTFEYAQGDFMPEAGAVYFHGSVDEERAVLDGDWERAALGAGVILASVVDETADSVQVRLGDPRSTGAFSLRSEQSIRDLLASMPDRIYIDVTALAHPTWAVLLRECIALGKAHSIVYTEPASYKLDDSPAQGMVYDLSERIAGIAPLPGFARFGAPSSEEGNLVALLGFEGARFAYVMKTLEVGLENVVPIVGVPGFVLHHPFESIDGNAESLRQDFLHSRLRLAKANCPFDAFHEIYRIFRDGDWSYGRVAPIGTKPHGVGAVLFALSRPNSTELIYDHPVRKAKRSLGKGRVCLYDTAAFCESDLYHGRGEYAGY